MFKNGGGMVYYLYFQCSCYHLLLHVCFIGSRFSEARFGRGNKMIPQERNMKILSTQQLAQLLKKENHRRKRKKSALFILKETTCFRRGFDFDSLILCVHLPSLYKAISQFFLVPQKLSIGDIVCHKFKGAVGIGIHIC